MHCQLLNCQFDNDLEALHLSKAAQIVRRDLFKLGNAFNGSFAKDCQVNSVPNSLLALVHVILEGPTIDDQSKLSFVPAALSIAQLHVFNSVKHARRKTEVGKAKIQHNVSQETPLPLYLALTLHSETRN